jgi:altronate hydrolase
MDDDIDIDCSSVLEGRPVTDVGAEIFELIVETASGRKTKSEALGLGDEEFVPWQIGAAM